MRNDIFDIKFDINDGCVAALRLIDDGDNMNWCADNGKWGYIHHINYDNIWGDYKSRQKDMKLIEFSEGEKSARSIYSNGLLQVTAERFFNADGTLTERFTFKNLVYADLFLNEHNCGIEVPFNDRYTYADDCLVHNCNAHIWCGLGTSYVNALKMGISKNNIGIVVTKGAFSSYSVLDCCVNNRGRFLLNLAPTELMQNEEYTVEWVVFKHGGKEDFKAKALKISGFTDIRAEHYTVFEGEEINFTATVGQKAENVRVYDKFGDIEYSVDDRTVSVRYLPKDLGEHRIFVEINGTVTYADFLVKEGFATLLEKRVEFIVEKQQYLRQGSPLDGAFLIYDNKEEHLIFEDCIPDHNACRERIGMGLLIARYLQTCKNKRFYSALMRYIDFVKREFYDSETGYVYNTVGKDKSQIRLYNAPWVGMLFCEMYYLTGDKAYLKEILSLFEAYYEIGGEKFYPNGISILRILTAFKAEKMDAEYDRLFELFGRHVGNMVKNRTSYPKHEANYEQTIVSPAVTFISEFAVLTGDEKYTAEAKEHIEILERFNGNQPSFHLNEIPIRYWDDFWFGRMRINGDTFPHYWSCLTARSYVDYYKASGDKKYLTAAEECIRNCLCLFTDDGRGSAAYVYPYRVDEKFGAAYDEWANDQDFALYFALEAGLLR